MRTENIYKKIIVDFKLFGEIKKETLSFKTVDQALAFISEKYPHSKILGWRTNVWDLI